MSSSDQMGLAFNTVWANVGIGCWDDDGCHIRPTHKEDLQAALKVLGSNIQKRIGAPAYEDLEELIRWLAMPYAGDPVWNLEGEDLSDSRARLKAAWEHTVGTKGPSGPGAWAQCQCCGMWQVVAVTEGEKVG